MLEKSKEFAEEKFDTLINNSLEQMVSTLSYEAKRFILMLPKKRLNLLKKESLHFMSISARPVSGWIISG
jgi:hypothetical protein